MDLNNLRKDIIEIGRRVYNRDFVASNDGNFSIKIDDERFLITPSGKSKGFLKEEELVIIDNKGEVIEGNLKPSSEFQLHLEIYKVRKECEAVVHTHPPISTGFAVAGIPLAEPVLPEVIISLGEIPIAEYATLSTLELSQKVKGLIKNHNAVLLKNHGLVTTGKDIYQAYYFTETVEHYAKILLVAKLLGNTTILTEEQVNKLIRLRTKYGLDDLFK